MKQCLRLALLLSLGWLIASASHAAELTLPHFFSDHMVLQRERQVSIWGSALPNAQVSVSFKGKTVRVKAGADGEWKTRIQSGSADGQGATLAIASGSETVAIQDVLVGEVWFASGQSNMVFSMDRVPAYAEIIEKADHPKLRMFNAPLVTAVDPQDDIEGAWTLCDPETVPRYSAVAFFFAARLHAELDIPVGVIKSAWGGKPVETFTSRSALNTLSGTKLLVDSLLQSDAGYDPEQALDYFNKSMARWEEAIVEWRKKPAAERRRAPRKPSKPKRPLDTEGKPGVLFNSMINPFVGYTIRGAIWYQGEGNAKVGAVPYDLTLPLLIRDWRQRWEDDFSFYFVQLANFRAPTTEAGAVDPWALLQDRQRRILKTTPKTGMAIINEVGDQHDIHPKDKKSVGDRLALWALAKDYGQDIVYSGPLFKSCSIETDKVRIAFEQVGSGLKSRDGAALKRFEIAGNDRVWHWAEAKLSGSDSVIVSSPNVKKPSAVRYAWASNPEGANLVNSVGLPASVFRTDDWDDVESKEALEAALNLEKSRALALEIRALAVKRAKLERSNAEYGRLMKRIEMLKDQRDALTPKETSK